MIICLLWILPAHWDQLQLRVDAVDDERAQSLVPSNEPSHLPAPIATHNVD